jgi:charged multivesicular body protein 4
VGVARKNAKTNKRAALQALKRKKRYEKQLQQIDGTLSTIEMQREALGKKDVLDIVSCLKETVSQDLQSCSFLNLDTLIPVP